ncbi:MAG: thiamine pyrophosphate-dependent enzyme [Actinomycetes bacterium]
MESGSASNQIVPVPCFAAGTAATECGAIEMRDAQAAAHAADGAARASGRAAVVAAAGLADSLRMAAGLVTARGDRQPVVAVAALGGPELELARPALETASRAVIDCRSSAIEPDGCLAALALGPPVVVIVSNLVGLATAVGRLREILPDWSPADRGGLEVDEEAILEALPALRESKRPVILVGHGAATAADLEAIATLARVWQAPVCLTFSATSMPAGTLEQFRSAFAVELPILPAGTVPWSTALARADRVLALGSGLSEADWFGLSDARLVRAPVTRVVLAPDPDGVAETTVPADAGDFAAALTNELERGGVLTRDGWIERFSEARSTWTELVDQEAERGAREDRLTPALAAREIVAAAPAGTVFVGEGGASGMWLASYAWLRPLVMPAQHASIGASIAMAAGIAEAEPTRPVWTVLGDGAFFYCARELSALAERGVPAVVFVFDDRSWNAIRLVQTLFFKRRTIGTDLPDVDFRNLAELHGCETLRVRTPGEMAMALSLAQESRTKPLVVDVRIEKGAIPFVGANLILAEVDGVLRTLAGSAALSSAVAAAKDRPALAANLRVIAGAVRK